MLWLICRTLIAAVTIFAVSELANRLPRLGALILSLPIISVLAFVMTWTQNKNIEVISRLAREPLILVPLGLVFFVPLALSERLHLAFWPALLIGLLSSTVVMGCWLWLGPKWL